MTTTVLIIAIGTRGDVAPFTGLGRHLTRAGYHVAIATQAPFADLVTACGLEYRELPGDPRAALASPEGRRTQRSGPLALARMLKLVKAGVREMGEGILAVAQQGADVVLLSMAAAPLGYHVADGLGVPSIGTSVVPAHPTADFPPPGLSAVVPSLGSWGNRTIARVSAAGTERMFLDTANDLRKTLGLPATTVRAVREQRTMRRWPLLHGFSPVVVPRPADWPDAVEVTGYWWPERPSDWQPPADLVDFLAAGPPPVFLSFGSAMPGDRAALAEIATTAMKQAGVRAVIQNGWADLTAGAEDLITIGDVPHDWLFPQMAAVVHHCGAGTTAAGLRAGIPAVGVPVSLDQPFWASRLTDLGVSPGWIRSGRLTAPRLAKAVSAVVADPAYRHRAQAVAEQIAAEDGPGYVVDAIDRTLDPLARRHP